MSLKVSVASSSFIASPDGRLIASVQQTCLEIRSSLNNELLQSFSLPQKVESKWRYLRWFESANPDTQYHRENGKHDQVIDPSHRILLANDDTVLIWDMADPNWRAELNGVARNLGKIAEAQFGFTMNDILVFSVFGIKVIIWSLLTNRGVEIRDPKLLPKCYDYRPCTGHLAILSRDTTHDSLMLLTPKNYELVKDIDLATVDAQGVLWSSDGRWLVIWDTASSGFKILIYTADGQLFKTYLGGQDAEHVGLGVKNVSWSPLSGILTIGDFNQRVVLLRTPTFSPISSLNHSTTINIPSALVWEEQISASAVRNYVIASQPICPPVEKLPVNGSAGISLIEYNGDGTLLATKSDLTPSTVWIWSVDKASAAVVLIHHSPVKRIKWNPSKTDQLLIHCNTNDPVFHIWKATWDLPRIVNLRLDQTGGKMEAAWLRDVDDISSLLIGNSYGFTIARITHDGQLLSSTADVKRIGTGPEDIFDEGNSLILSPIKISHDEVTTGIRHGSSEITALGRWAISDEVQDTFHYRRHPKTAT